MVIQVQVAPHADAGRHRTALPEIPGNGQMTRENRGFTASGGGVWSR